MHSVYYPRLCVKTTDECKNSYSKMFFGHKSLFSISVFFFLYYKFRTSSTSAKFEIHEKSTIPISRFLVVWTTKKHGLCWVFLVKYRLVIFQHFANILRGFVAGGILVSFEISIYILSQINPNMSVKCFETFIHRALIKYVSPLLNLGSLEIGTIHLGEIYL